MYQATKDDMFLDFGESFLQAIETTAKTKCGYASVSYAMIRYLVVVLDQLSLYRNKKKVELYNIFLLYVQTNNSLNSFLVTSLI